MKKTSAAIGFVLFLFYSGLIFGSDFATMNPIKRIAEITTGLLYSQYPSDDDKSELNRIMNNEGVNKNLRLIAHVLLNYKDSVNDTDKSGLDEIIADKTVYISIRQLAKIINSNHHSASNDDIVVLKNIIEK